MAKLTTEEVDNLFKEFIQLGNDLKENNELTDDIQARTGKSLSTKAKRDVFANYMTKLFQTDKAMVKRHQDCISKTPTQRYIQNLKVDAPLTHRIAIRTANNGLVNQGLAQKEQVAQKNVYFQFKIPVNKPKVLTNKERLQKDITDGKVTKKQFDAWTFKWHGDE